MVNKFNILDHLGTPILKQDLIDNLNFADTRRVFRYNFGRNTNVDNVMVDLWEGPTGGYVFPTTAQQMSVVSTDSNDTAAGTGARQIHIHYLDNNYVEQSETVTLNGTTATLTTSNNILRVNGVHTWSAGSGGVPAGNISVKNSAGTVTYGYMSAGINVSMQSNFTVPTGKSMYVSQWRASSGSSAGGHFCQIFLRATAHQGVLLSGVFLVHDVIGTQDSGLSVNYQIPVRLPATSDIKISAISDSGTANVTAIGAISGWFEDIIT